jgi:Putative zinc-finger
MKCSTVQHGLAGYLDAAATNEAATAERLELRAHLDSCAACREELQRYRRLGVLLSRTPKVAPPSDLAIRIKVAAAQAEGTRGLRGRWQQARDRVEILFENVFGPLTLPATGGFFSAIIIFTLALQLILPGLVVRADPNDVPLDLMQPAQLVALSDYPQSWAPEEHDAQLSLPHGLLVDVTVDARGQMAEYQILSGPNSLAMRRQLDQMLLFSRFRPMMSFGRPTSGGHVVLSFSAIRVHG